MKTVDRHFEQMDLVQTGLVSVDTETETET